MESLGGRAVICFMLQGRLCAWCCLPGTSLDFIPTRVPWVRAHRHLPALPSMRSLGSFSEDCPVRVPAARYSSCAETATMTSRLSLFPGLVAGSFTCLNNNILRIDCHWSAVEPGQGPSPWLLFTR